MVEEEDEVVDVVEEGEEEVVVEEAVAEGVVEVEINNQIKIKRPTRLQLPPEEEAV